MRKRLHNWFLKHSKVYSKIHDKIVWRRWRRFYVSFLKKSNPKPPKKGWGWKIKNPLVYFNLNYTKNVKTENTNKYECAWQKSGGNIPR